MTLATTLVCMFALTGKRKRMLLLTFLTFASLC